MLEPRPRDRLTCATVLSRPGDRRLVVVRDRV